MTGSVRRGTLRALLTDGYHDLKRVLASRLGSVEAASDVLHETYLRLERFDSLAPVANPQAYLLRMALNAAADHERGEKRVLAAVEIDDLWRLGDDTLDPETIADSGRPLGAGALQSRVERTAAAQPSDPDRGPR